MDHPPIRYAMISTELRRDSDDPLRLFENVQVRHFYRITTMPGSVEGVFGPHTERYSTPWDLTARLARWNPHVVQGVEPFALITAPYSAALNWYLRHRKTALITVSLENVPLETKYGRLGAAALGPLIRRGVQRSGVVVAVNDGAAANFKRYGARPDRIRRMLWGNPGIDLQDFSPNGPRNDFRRAPNEVVIAFVGRVVEAKGIFDLLDAFELVVRESAMPVRLVVIGGGSGSAELTRRIERAQLGEHVTMVGPLPSHEIAAVLRGADLVAVPSRTTQRWAEQIGMVFVQAMGCGVPVITTSSGSIPEFVPHGEVGLLVEEGQIRQLAGAITRLVTDSGLRRRLGTNGRNLARARYDVRRNMRVIEDLIIALCVGECGAQQSQHDCVA